MMNGHRFFRMKIREPAKTETKGPASFFRVFQMLVKSLKGSNGVTSGRYLLRFAHHLSFVGAVAVQCDQQRRRTRFSRVEIVIELNLAGKRLVSQVRVVIHRRHRPMMLIPRLNRAKHFARLLCLTSTDAI